MNRSHDTNPSAPVAPTPRRPLSPQELEAAIGRAIELQAGDAEPGSAGFSDEDVVRIGRELGLDPATVRRAVAEVRARPAAEKGVLGRAMGPATVRASRLIACPTSGVPGRMETYLRDTELMEPQRRFPDRTRFVRDSSLAAGVARFARTVTRSTRPLDLQQVDVAVAPIDDARCLLEVSSDLSGARAGHAGGAVAIGGSVAGGLTAVALATAMPDPFVLLGIPILGSAWGGMRAAYGATRRSTREKLETLLDRLEHDVLT